MEAEPELFDARYWRLYERYGEFFATPDEAFEYLERRQSLGEIDQIGVFHDNKQIELTDEGVGWRYLNESDRQESENHDAADGGTVRPEPDAAGSDGPERAQGDG